MGRPLARILMCRPDYFRVMYKINPWMTTDEAVSPTKVQNQWNNLKDTLEKCGAQVEVMEGQPDVPDLVFTANAALIRGKKAYLSHFHNEERIPERTHNMKWLSENGFEVHGGADFPYEGAGDSLFAGDKLFAGFGFRTKAPVYEDIENRLGPFQKRILCELIDPYFYHIDTAFCPLNKELAIFHRRAFSEESVKRMENEIELIEVPEREAKQFSCNTVAVGGKHAVLPAGNLETAKLIEKNGIEAHLVDVSEFLKAGGACKCLTLTLE